MNEILYTEVKSMSTINSLKKEDETRTPVDVAGTSDLTNWAKPSSHEEHEPTRLIVDCYDKESII
jgi:hypothetical protein